MTDDVVVLLAAAGVAGQVLVALLAAVGILALAGVGRPLALVRDSVWGYELWLVFAVAAIGTGGSLYLSEVAGYVPCELCWYQRICLYPLAVIALLAALRNDFRVSRYLLPLPIVGAGLAVYQLLLENHVVSQTQACLISAPGGCATKWIDEFGFVTIPTLALTAFALLTAFLLLASTGEEEQR